MMNRDQVELVVNKLNDLGLIRKHRVSGQWIQIACPFHNDGNEKRPSCGILLEDQYKNGQKYFAGFHHCFACGHSGDMPTMITDLLKVKNIGKSGLEWLSENIPGFDSTSYDFEYLLPGDNLESLTAKFAVDYLTQLTQPKASYVSEEELASYRYTVPYMYERKLTDEVIAKYDIGFDPNFIPPGRSKKLPCITMPVRDSYGTLFFCRRSIEGKYYNYPEGVTKPVFGLHDLPKGTKSVIVCESIINALTCIVYEYPAVALMGTGNTYQIDQLKKSGISEFVLFLDGDDAGRRGADKLKRALRKTSLVWIIPTPDGRDANDMTKDEVDELYSMKE